MLFLRRGFRVIFPVPAFQGLDNSKYPLEPAADITVLLLCDLQALKFRLRTAQFLLKFLYAGTQLPIVQDNVLDPLLHFREPRSQIASACPSPSLPDADHGQPPALHNRAFSCSADGTPALP